MSSTNAVNFSLRPNKAIERAVVIDGIARFMRRLTLPPDYVYVGLGSVWFTDFELAHSHLGIRTLVSMESDETTYRRACFNRPYKNVDVRFGKSYDLLGDLLLENELKDRPWVLWLDYDDEVDLDKLNELSDMVRELPRESFLITTFSALKTKYGTNPADRREFIQGIFGDSAPDDIPSAELKDDLRFLALLSTCAENHLASVASRYAVDYVPAFFLPYRDGSPMVTVGGFLATDETRAMAQSVVDAEDWEGRVRSPIVAPPLTPLEVTLLRAELPRGDKLTRERVREIGFDLDEDGIEIFCRHYLQYPSYAQLAR